MEPMQNNKTGWDVKLKLICGIIFGFILSMIWILFTISGSSNPVMSHDPVKIWVLFGLILILFIFGTFLSCFIFFRNSSDIFKKKQYHLSVLSLLGAITGFIVWLAIVAAASWLKLQFNYGLEDICGCIFMLILILIFWYHYKDK